MILIWMNLIWVNLIWTNLVAHIPARACCGQHRMQDDGLEASILNQSDCAGAGSGQFGGALDKLAGEIRQAQQAINVARQLGERLGAFAVLLR